MAWPRLIMQRFLKRALTRALLKSQPEAGVLFKDALLLLGVQRLQRPNVPLLHEPHAAERLHRYADVGALHKALYSVNKIIYQHASVINE